MAPGRTGAEDCGDRAEGHHPPLLLSSDHNVCSRLRDRCIYITRPYSSLLMLADGDIVTDDGKTRKKKPEIEDESVEFRFPKP